MEIAAAAAANAGKANYAAPARKIVTVKGAFSFELVSWILKPHLPY